MRCDLDCELCGGWERFPWHGFRPHCSAPCPGRHVNIAPCLLSSALFFSSPCRSVTMQLNYPIPSFSFLQFRNRRFDCFYDNDWTFHGNINGTKRRLTKNNLCCKSLRAHQFQFLAFIFREQFFQRCDDVLFQWSEESDSECVSIICEVQWQ